MCCSVQGPFDDLLGAVLLQQATPTAATTRTTAPSPRRSCVTWRCRRGLHGHSSASPEYRRRTVITAALSEASSGQRSRSAAKACRKAGAETATPGATRIAESVRTALDRYPEKSRPATRAEGDTVCAC